MRTAVVVGAGIGGVTVTSALAQAGWRVTLLERAPELGEVGAGISVWPGAMRVLDNLGVGEALRADTVATGPAGLRRPDGRWVARVDSTRLDIPVMVHRARLHEAILASVPDTVEIRTGVTVTDADPAGAVVTDAGDRIAGDLVVAADGLRSVVRSALHPGPRPRYAGYTAYRGLAPAGTADGGGETWGRGSRFGYAPLSDGRIYWYATANTPPGRVVDAHGDVVRRFTAWHDPIPALLAATPADAVLHNDVYDLPLPLAPFASGRVALLGDAAHAMTPNLGRGACAAIEDAAALTRLLGAYDEIATALTSYDAERRRPTATLIRRSRLVGAVGQLDNRFALALRDTALRAAGALAGRRAAGEDSRADAGH